MNHYRLDIYTHADRYPAPSERREFRSPNHTHAANCADEVMVRRPRGGDGVLYDVTAGFDDYVVTISGEA